MTNVGVGGSAPSDVDLGGRQPDLLVRLAQRRVEQRLVRVAAAAGERDLAGMAAQVVAAAGEDRVQRAARILEQRHEDGRVLAAVHVHRRGLVRLEEHGGELSGGAQASSTRSSNATSPSSVRCTGHLAAITCSRSICSSSRCAGILKTSSKRVGQPRSAGV